MKIEKERPCPYRQGRIQGTVQCFNCIFHHINLNNKTNEGLGGCSADYYTDEQRANKLRLINFINKRAKR